MAVNPSQFTESDFLWKYMGLWKFLDLLDTKSLFFAPPSSMADPNERLWNVNSDDFVISCWHENEFENILMWKTYIQDSYGIAIKVKAQNLENEFAVNYVWSRANAGRKEFYGQKVSYTKIDPNSEIYKYNPSLYALFLKSNEYKSESEYRIVGNVRVHFTKQFGDVLYLSDEVRKKVDDMFNAYRGNKIKGYNVPFNLNLIDEVVFFPHIKPQIKKMVIDKIKSLNLNIMCTDSSCLERI